jgi:hypothetical protein
VVLWAKGLNATDIHKQTFPVHGGKGLLHKVFHSWVENVSLMRKRLKWKWLRQQSKELYAAGFSALVKR